MEAGCHGNSQDDIGRTPLMHACAAGDAGLASALIGRGADPAATDRWGMYGAASWMPALPPRTVLYCTGRTAARHP
jgi:hypothetical protein